MWNNHCTTSSHRLFRHKQIYMYVFINAVWQNSWVKTLLNSQPQGKEDQHRASLSGFTGWCLLMLRYSPCLLPLTAPVSLSLCLSWSLSIFNYLPTTFIHSAPHCLSGRLCSFCSFSPIPCSFVSLPCRYSFILPSLCLPLAPCACTWLLSL